MLQGTVTIRNNVKSAPQKHIIFCQGEYFIMFWDHQYSTVSNEEYLLTVLLKLFLSAVINNTAAR